ncbi:MAG TPA: hypothetical protein VMH81_27530 [Bryobacteraceae bacterium]|nr:hypothetical protein [Bryobacteraceae bacterium]
MRFNLQRTGMSALAVLALAALPAPDATACGSVTQRVPLKAAPSSPPVRLPAPPISAPLPLPLANGEQAMTGLWKEVLVSDGQLVMVEFDTWHDDGTELALDGLFPPATGNVCPGVWERTGPKTFSTVHPAFEYDDAGINVVAIFVERMQVTISDDGNSFDGTFTWDNFDFQGNLLPGSINGTVTGTRIQVGSPFPFPFPL